MFGKGGGALSIWIKEFCELVFIQTLQAFIYAIVINFVVKILSAGNVAAGNMSTDDYNTAVGIICVVALVSIFKVEDLARKIFGFGPTKADHGNAMASIAKTAFALKMGKNVLDNGKKLFGGIGTVARTPLKRIKAKKDYNEEVEAYKKDNGLLGEVTKASSAGRDTATQRRADSAKREQKIQLQDNADKYSKTSEKDMSALGSSSSGASSSSASSGFPKDYYQKMRQFKKNYDKEISEINKNKREGIKNIARGVLESGGAVVGFTTGAIIGGADGNLGEAIQGGLTGMGAGDIVGKSMVDVPSAIYEYGEDVKKDIKGAMKKSSSSTSRSSRTTSTRSTNYNVKTPKVSVPKSSVGNVVTPTVPNLSKVVDSFVAERDAQNEEIVAAYETEVAERFENVGRDLEAESKNADAALQSELDNISSNAQRSTRRLERGVRSSTRTSHRTHVGGRGISSSSHRVHRPVSIGLRNQGGMKDPVSNAILMNELKDGVTKGAYDAKDDFT